MAIAPHKIAGISGGRDENGVITLTQPWWCETLKECFEVGEDSVLINARSRLLELTRGFGVWDPDTITNGYQIGITYQGVDFSLDSKKTERFGYDSEYSLQSVDTHPDLNILIEKHGGRLVDSGDGGKKLVFTPAIEGGAGGGAGGFGQGQTGTDEKNPNFGYSTYPLYESIWTHTYVVRRLPKDFLDRISTVVDSPPGNPPTPKKRNWLIMTPELEIFPGEGGYRITDRYKLSVPGGVPAVYRRLAVT